MHGDWRGSDHAMGVAVLSHGVWTKGTAPTDWVKAATAEKTYSSSQLEAGVLLLALETFPGLVANRNVVFFSDNLGFVQAYNHPTIQTGALAQYISAAANRQIQLNCHVRVLFVPGDYNFADTITRYPPQVFLQRTCDAKLSMTPSPVAARFPAVPRC